MNEENETFDNFPIINSFLTTIPEQSAPPTHRTMSPRETSQPFTKQVDEWFQAESKALQAKKQRELMKQNRLRQLQDEFEAQRKRKQKELDQKLTSIERNKNKNLMSIQEKLHKISVRHNKVFTKVQDEHLKELRQHYDSRKAYEIETSRHSTRLINTSQQSNQDSRHRSARDSKTKTLQQEVASSKMNEIAQRLEKAKTMSKERQEETVNKARNHNIFELYQVQSKAKEQYDDYLKLYASKIVSKMESADLNKDKMQKKLEKQNQQRHKAYSEKLKRIQTNLIQRQQQQEQRFQELGKKLVRFMQTQQRAGGGGKGERQHRETLYHKRFLGNLQQLQREKISRADQIIQKHQEITLKNRLFKEKKQTLYKNLKVDAL